MSPSLEQLKVSIASLPAPQRAELAQYLLRSLDAEEPGAKDEWLSLAQERMGEVRAGKVVGIPAAEVLRSLPGTGR